MTDQIKATEASETIEATQAAEPRETLSETLSLSHSQLETWGQCPAKWAFQKIMRLPQAPSDALILGDATHQAIEADGRRRMATRTGLTLDALTAVFTHALYERLGTDDPWGLLQGNRVEMRARGLAMLRAYHEQYALGYNPTAVEAPFPDVLLEPEADSDPAIRFTGRIDARVERFVGGHSLGLPLPDHAHGVRDIVDFKSSGKPWPDGVEHTKEQATAYLWADARGYERPANRVTFVVMTTRLTGPEGWTATVDARETTRTPEQLAAYERRVRAVAGEIVAAKAAPQPVFEAKTGPLCGWCGYWAQCEAGKAWLRAKGRSPAVPGVNDRGEPVAWE